MSECRVEVEVVLLDVLAVIPLAVGQPEQPLLDDGVPHGRQFVSAVEPRQGDGIAPVDLDPIARTSRGERGRYYRTVVAELGDLPVDGVAAGAGLVAELQSLVTLSQLRD
jgi:hypothetical protein